MSASHSPEIFLPQVHDNSTFSCENKELDTYIREYAGQDLKRQLAQIFVLCEEETNKIIAYYTISTTSFKKEFLPVHEAKKFPHYPIPAALIGRLATDKKWQGKGLGERMLVDSLKRILKATQNLGINVVLVVSKDERAKSFYLKYGFIPLIHNPLHLYLPIKILSKLPN
jgi:predicted GNAT family N-acyltransferase